MSRQFWIRIAIAILVAFAALLLVRLHNATGATIEPDSISAGRKLAEAWCKNCHALDEAGADQPGRGPDFAGIANRASTTELSLKVFFQSNHQSMPDLIIAPDQADNLAHYILSLKRG